MAVIICGSLGILWLKTALPHTWWAVLADGQRPWLSSAPSGFILHRHIGHLHRVLRRRERDHNVS